MIKKIDFKMLLGSLVSLSIGVGTQLGIVQNYVHFAGVENEMGFCFLSYFLGIILMLGIKK